MKGFIKKNRLRIAGILGVLGFLLICNDPSLGVENYEEYLLDYIPNLVGIVLFGVCAWLCDMDYKANPKKYEY